MRIEKIGELAAKVRENIARVIVGHEDSLELMMTALICGGHVLLDDVPGTGKTVTAKALARSVDCGFKRIQFTPDTMPSDIMGFSLYDKDAGSFRFTMGAVNCNLLLGDEINRTSAKTQSALLEVMEEMAVTVDGVTHPVPRPFVCIATQNPVGSVGTQPLPDSQLDRFMVRLSIGYPSTADQVDIIKSRRHANPLEDVRPMVSRDDLLAVQNYLDSIAVSDEVLLYITRLCEATRAIDLVELGVSPRGIIALSRMARACALMRDRDYVTPEDVREVFVDVCAHRLVLRPQARIESVSAADILRSVMESVAPPSLGSPAHVRR